MEPAAERREHGDWEPLILSAGWTPQWSPPLNGGSTAPRFRAVLTCADRWSRERSGPGGAVGPSDGLVKIQEMSTDLRASAPGGCVTTSALALKMMTARDEGSFSW